MTVSVHLGMVCGVCQGYHVIFSHALHASDGGLYGVWPSLGLPEDVWVKDMVSSFVLTLPATIATVMLARALFSLKIEMTMFRVLVMVTVVDVVSLLVTEYAFVRPYSASFGAADGGTGGDGGDGGVAAAAAGAGMGKQSAAVAAGAAVGGVEEPLKNATTTAAAAAAAAFKSTFFNNSRSSSSAVELASRFLFGGGGSYDLISGELESSLFDTRRTLASFTSVAAGAVRWVVQGLLAIVYRSTCYFFTGVRLIAEFVAAVLVISLGATQALPFWVLYVFQSRQSATLFQETQMHRAILVRSGTLHVGFGLFWVISMVRWPCPRVAFFVQTALALELWVIAVGAAVRLETSRPSTLLLKATGFKNFVTETCMNRVVDFLLSKRFQDFAPLTSRRCWQGGSAR